MKVNSFAKVGLVLGTAALAVCTLTAPAQADIQSGYATLVGYGSDTTQDVMNAIASDINTDAGANLIQSIDASVANPVLGTNEKVVVRAGQSAANGTPRAAGSGEGFNLLKFAMGFTSSGTATDVAGNAQTLTKANTIGKVDFNRASSKRGTTQSNSGVFVNIPFAKDAVTVAFDPTSHLASVPSFAKGASGDSTYASASDPVSLYRVYNCGTQYTYFLNGQYVGAGASATPSSDSSSNAVAWKAGFTSDELAAIDSFKINVTIPKFGSGTREFMAGQLGQSGSNKGASWEANNSCVFSKWDGTSALALGTAPGAINIEEHDGTVADAVTDALAFYSIPMWVGQSRSSISGSTDRRHGVSLGSVTSSGTTYAPTTGSGLDYATNASFPINRVVYNVVSSKLADDVTSDIYDMFVTETRDGYATHVAKVCQQHSAITRMGFVELSGLASAGVDQCGSTTALLRYDNAITVADAATAPILCRQDTDDDTNVVASVAVGSSNSDMGGTVTAKQGNTIIGVGTVPAGKRLANVPVTLVDNATAVTFKFAPRLTGLATKTLASVSGASIRSIADCTTVSLGGKITSTIGGTASVDAWVTSLTAPAGSITLKDADNLAADITANVVTVAAGASKVTLTFKPTKHIQRVVAVFTPTDAVANVGSTSAARTITSPFLATAMTVAKTAGISAQAGFWGKLSRATDAAQTFTFSFTAPAGKTAVSGTVDVYATDAVSTDASSITTRTKIGTATISAGTGTLVLSATGGLNGASNNVSSWISALKGTGTVTRYLNFKFSGDDRYDVKYLFNQKIQIIG